MDITLRHRSSGGYELPDLITLEPGRRSAGSLSEMAYYLLRDRLITLEIPPGATIDERALQADLGLGRTPVREALRRLADDRLVHVVPRRGMFARHVDLGDLSAISEIRIEFESYAAYLAANRATAADRNAIADMLGELDAAREATDHRELIRLDLRTHRIVHRAAHNAYLAATLEEYYVHSLRMWFLVLDRVQRLDRAVEEHRELLAAVLEGNAHAAEQILRKHVAAFEGEIRAVL
ncbi:GntR family transcriptional regulator [Haloechinothrix sp. YIM 98757]|uniref:GntR family transcriptional regulator n=1 Tax=Haloechinothrix aidingensis TaxID=2752311 RepID=A0A838A914_9PSEU|nr:GntR family transcriptional regulator [Haloechinothrix aidingensis]MBA0125049.1 GntR family transcriptional regulator [Haloechinothrix aidingensis]